MDKYVRVEAPKPEPPAVPVPNEARVMTDGKMRNYIKYATTLLLVRKGFPHSLKALLPIRRVEEYRRDVSMPSPLSPHSGM